MSKTLTAFRSTALRPLLVLLTALMLASTALVAVTTEVHAAKQWPTITNYSSDCTSGTTRNTWTARWDVEGKGRWAYVEVQRQVIGVSPWGVSAPAGTRLDMFLDPPNLVRSVSASGATLAQFRARITDNKGEPQGEWVESPLITC